MIDKYLSPSENVLVVCRRHPFVLIKPVIIWLLLVAGAGVVGALISPEATDSMADRIAGGIAAAATLMTMARVMTWWTSRYVITNERVLSIQGIVFRKIRAVMLEGVGDTTYTRSLLGRVFGYGDVVISAAYRDATPLMTVGSVTRPIEFYRQLISAVSRLSMNQRRSVLRFDDEDTGPIPQVAR